MKINTSAHFTAKLCTIFAVKKKQLFTAYLTYFSNFSSTRECFLIRALLNDRLSEFRAEHFQTADAFWRDLYNWKLTIVETDVHGGVIGTRVHFVHYKCTRQIAQSFHPHPAPNPPLLVETLHTERVRHVLGIRDIQVIADFLFVQESEKREGFWHEIDVWFMMLLKGRYLQHSCGLKANSQHLKISRYYELGSYWGSILFRSSNVISRLTFTPSQAPVLFSHIICNHMG